MMAAHLAFSPLTGAVAGLPTAAAIFPDLNRTLSGETVVNPRPELVAEAAKIDAYLASRKSPLVGYGLKFAQTADDNDLPYNLLPAVSVVESGAGTQACKNDSANVFGFMSCKKVDFDSYDEAIDVVGRTLAGKIPVSAYHYEGKKLSEILVTYNGHANRNYVKNVYSVMDQIDQMDVSTDTTVAAAPIAKA